MSISYVHIRRQVALRSAQLAGSDQDTLETAYTETVFADGVDGAEVPTSAIKDLILMIEKEIAQSIGNNTSHPARSFLYGRTADLDNLDTIPTVDNANVEFVGVFDSCADADDNKTVTYQPSQIINDVRQSFFDDIDLYNYNITGNYITHTRDSVYLQGCVWDYTTQSEEYDAAGSSPLPEAMANTWVAGVMSNLPQVGWVDGAGVAQYYAQLYQQGMTMIQGGSMPLAAQVTSGVAG